MSKPYKDYVKYLNETVCIPSVQNYQAIDMFAGCGGLSLGFEAAGIRTVGYDMVGDCCETYQKNLKSQCNQEVIDENSVFPYVDIIIGGPPCMPFSRRGKQKGKMMQETVFRHLLRLSVV